MRVTTLDLSPRVNRHLDGARAARAMRGEPYVLQLPLAKDDPKHQWHPDLVAYWQRVRRADRRGGRADPAAGRRRRRAGAGGARCVRRSCCRSRRRTSTSSSSAWSRCPTTERFDLIVATNILVYYDAFEQGLALANISKMLRPGGYFVTNYAVSPLPPLEPSASIVTSVFFDKQRNGDTIFCYRRDH